jgi:hypothetical protein
MHGRPFTLLAAVSALLCLAVIGCGVFSFFAPFGQGWDTSWGGNADGYRMRVWVAERGSLHLLRHDEQVTPVTPSNPGHLYHGGYDPAGRMMLRPEPTRLGFAYHNDRSGWVEPSRGPRRRTVIQISSQLSLPLWLPALLLALPPATWLLARRRRARQRARGFCPSCGYDLRATPERCPECGMATPTAAPPTAKNTEQHGPFRLTGYPALPPGFNR